MQPHKVEALTTAQIFIQESPLVPAKESLTTEKNPITYVWKCNVTKLKHYQMQVNMCVRTSWPLKKCVHSEKPTWRSGAPGPGTPGMHGGLATPPGAAPGTPWMHGGLRQLTPRHARDGDDDAGMSSFVDHIFLRYFIFLSTSKCTCPHQICFDYVEWFAIAPSTGVARRHTASARVAGLVEGRFYLHLWAACTKLYIESNT